MAAADFAAVSLGHDGGCLADKVRLVRRVLHGRSYSSFLRDVQCRDPISQQVVFFFFVPCRICVCGGIEDIRIMGRIGIGKMDDGV